MPSLSHTGQTKPTKSNLLRLSPLLLPTAGYYKNSTIVIKNACFRIFIRDTCTSKPLSGQWRTGVGSNISYCPLVTIRGGRYSKWKIFTNVIHFMSQLGNKIFLKKSVCKIYRYPRMPNPPSGWWCQKSLFLVHKNGCIFVGGNLIETKLRELKEHISRRLKHRSDNLNN